jgi:hypothetical protein
MNATHDSYFRHLAAYEPDLERWRLRAHELERPEPGSELHDDNKSFEFHPISDVARLSLASAGEHLRLAWTSIKAGELYPSAHFTALRGALVAASQALYILGPDEASVRRSRGLAVAVEGYRRLRQFHADCLDIPDLSNPEREAVQNQLRWLDTRIQGAVAAGAQKGGINLTGEVIPYAAAYVYGSTPKLEHMLNLQWRQMSGDAHALGWALTLRATLGPPKRGEPLSAGTAGGSLEDIAQPFEASYRLLKNGWSLFDRRCESL